MHGWKYINWENVYGSTDAIDPWADPERDQEKYYSPRPRIRIRSRIKNVGVPRSRERTKAS